MTAARATDVAASCVAELESIHVEIAAWFDGSAAPDALDAIVARFAPDFTLVTTAGASLDRDGLARLFAQARGARRGCTIEIREIGVVAAWEGGAVLSFAEHQSSEVATNVRRSTAVFSIDAAGVVRWRRLHETFVTA